MQNKRKGQAAIEFLITYGWAIMAAIVTIGALSYFGIFNTQKYVNDACYFGDQFTCEDYIAFQNGTIGVALRNNFGVSVDINSTVLKSKYGDLNCNTNNIIPSPIGIPPGETFKMNCKVSNTAISLNDKLKYRVIIAFKRTNSTNLHNQTGDVTISVQKS
jgi:hypothetical protein